MDKIEIYTGDIFWLLEGLKLNDNDYNFDKASKKLRLLHKVDNIKDLVIFDKQCKSNISSINFNNNKNNINTNFNHSKNNTSITSINQNFNRDSNINFNLNDNIVNSKFTDKTNYKYRSVLPDINKLHKTKSINKITTDIKNIDLKKCNSFFIYECLVFNDEKEDSLYFQEGNLLKEYFSSDRCDLFLKLLKIYCHKYPNNYTCNNTNYTINECTKPTIKKERNNDNINDINNEKNKSNNSTNNYINSKSINIQKDVNNKNTGVKLNKYNIMLNYSSKQTELIYDKIYCNLCLQYSDNKFIWINNYEVKKLLFNFKFLPNYTKIKILRLFPLKVNKLSIKNISVSFSYSDSIINTGKSIEEIEYDVYCSKIIKNMFYNKYGLNLKKFDCEAALINNLFYIYDVKEIKFEKYDNNYIELRCEKKLRDFKINYKYFNLEINKDYPNITEIKKLLDIMENSYTNVKKTFNLNKYLIKPPKDLHSDETFKILKDNVPFNFSDLLDDRFTAKEFAYFCSNKLYKNY